MPSTPSPAWTATAIATAVRDGTADPRAAVEASLAAIAERNGAVNAFIVVRDAAARAEAAALADRGDLADLPLAGVPVAIKDNLDVAGEPTRHGSRAFGTTPANRDHPTVARLRAAGAIVVGKTHIPELGGFGSTDGYLGTSHNPWQLDRITGGSSGGSAAAVAAGMVPVALGTDGMGSIRIPAAACGLFGLKPGPDVVPSELGPSSWFGLSENGPLTTCVEDARLMLAVLAGLAPAAAPPPPATLRIAVSTKPPVLGTRIASAWRGAVADAARVLGRAGHQVVRHDPPYRPLDAVTLAAYWTAALAQDAEPLDAGLLERRTRGHLRLDAVIRATGFPRERHRDAWTRRLQGFFDEHDVLVTPTLAQPPPRSREWHRRSWAATVWRDASYAPFAARFNLGRVPAASVPWGLDGQGLPLAVQLVAWRGGEQLLLDVAQQLEALHPWPTHPPAYAPPRPPARTPS